MHDNKRVHTTGTDLDRDRDLNPDPITGAPGSHPIGTGIGAAGAGAVGAAIGAVGGPVGSLAGAAIGAIVGGLAGKGVAEAIDPTAEEAFWRENYRSREYVAEHHTFDDYHPAYQLGWEGRKRHHARDFSEVEHDLGRDWDKIRGKSTLDWDRAKPATRDAWDRAHQVATRTGSGGVDLSNTTLDSRNSAGTTIGATVPPVASGHFATDVGGGLTGTTTSHTGGTTGRVSDAIERAIPGDSDRDGK